MSMFCYQCQEAANGSGCEIKGVCGKSPSTAQLQDVLLHVARGVSIFARMLPKVPDGAGHWMLEALFTTITNANFDDDQIEQKIKAGLQWRAMLADLCEKAEIVVPGHLEHAATFLPMDRQEMLLVAPRCGVLRTSHEDVRSLRELLTYGLKGLAAYIWHALEAGKSDPELVAFMYEGLAISLLEENPDTLVQSVLKTGAMGVKGMALLDSANTSRYGNPEITQVKTHAGTRPGILVSGHDLVDLEALLEQSKDAGIDIYTHSEMLPAHYYPAFKKYSHFFGNYGNAWWQQVSEFDKFHGPILFTTNCIVPPPANSTYADKVFTTGAAGFPGFRHVSKSDIGTKDFSEIIQLAKQCSAPETLEEKTLVGGFAHHQVSQLAGPILEAIQSGAIRKFVVMAGCDGRMKSRSYYTDYAESLPLDTVILTAGCAKYRYNKLDLGSIGGIPRVLDAGQCNDSYSLAVTALLLKDALGLEDINDLPIEYNIAWYEQKAVIVLLALLHLGVKNIHLGPTLPAFLSPGVAEILVNTFGIGGIASVEEDMQRILPVM